MQTDCLILSSVLWFATVVWLMLWSFATVYDVLDRRKREIPKPAIPKLALPGFALCLLFFLGIVATMLYLPYHLLLRCVVAPEEVK